MHAPSDFPSTRGRFHYLLASVFLLYCVVGFLLFRCRAVSLFVSCQSDVVIFALPFFVAAAINFSILFFWRRPSSLAGVARLFAISIGLAVLAWWIYMLFGVGIYGE